MVVNINNIIQSESAMTPAQGNSVFDEIERNLDSILRNEEELIFDFRDTHDLTTAFLNNCLGKLFYTMPTDYLLKKLGFQNLSNTSQVKSIRLTIETALLNLDKESV